jgi:EAL domain-containing protein (putative c-di-GMP-specific phosphodiesterase class I)
MLLETIISLGHRLHVTLLAEGIETQDQLRKLLRLGCTFGQGFLFSRAVAAGDVADLLAKGTYKTLADLHIPTTSAY